MGPPRTYRIHHKSQSNDCKWEIDANTDQIEYIVRSCPLSSKGTILCESSTGKELIRIDKEKVHLHTRYDISKVTNENNEHLGTIKWIHHPHSQSRFEVDSIYGVYIVDRAGCPFNHQFQLKTGDQVVVDIGNDVNSSKDKNIYYLQISDDYGGDLFLLALVIAIWSAQRLSHLL